ncbi:unnamed protein product, partial [Timema podura]|nr:unnamed protein product [Timema podura]
SENNGISIFSSLLNILVRFVHQVLSLHDVTPVLDIIYVNIIKPSRKERPFVAKFTSNLILACADILELPTQEFLQSCLAGKILPKGSLVSEGKLDLIGQLHKICPWLVATVWGQLRHILKERNSPDRSQTLMLLAKMFCKSQSNYITQHYSTWRVFLDRFVG